MAGSALREARAAAANALAEMANVVTTTGPRSKDAGIGEAMVTRGVFFM
jgi:hypothetical protein